MPEDELASNQEAQTEEPTESDVDLAEQAEEQDALAELKEVIQVEVEDVGTLRKKLTITIPRETIDERLEAQYGELSRDALVPGFRKGRAPRRLIEKRFGSEVSEQLSTELVGSGYLAAVDKAELKVLGDPMIWIKVKQDQAEGDAGPAETEKLVTVREAFEHIKLPEQGPLTFACEVEVQPEFDLPKLEGIPIEKPSIQITDEDVTRQIDRFRAMRGTYEPVTDGGIEQDDLVIAHVAMRVDGRVIKQEENVRLAARPQRVDNIPLEELGQVLAGAKPGDTRSIEAQIPDEYERPDLAGKTATFELTIQEIKRLVLPPLDEAFLNALGFENEQDLRDWIRNDLEARLDETIRRGMRAQVFRYLLENTRLDVPVGLSQRQADRVVARRMLELRREGVPEAEIEKRLDELRTSASEQASADLKLFFIMEKIAQTLEIEATEDEVNGQIALIARQYNRRFDRVRDELAQRGMLDQLYLQIRDDKIVDRLIEQAEVTEKAPDQAEESTSAEQSQAPAKAKTKARKKRAKPSQQAGDYDEET